MNIKYIYCTTNKNNGKIYIGKYTDISKNGFDNYIGSGTYFSNAVKKHRKENFYKEVLEIYKNEEELCQAEKWYIAYFRSLGFDKETMYNIGEGGECGYMLKYASKEYKDAVKAKISKAHMGVGLGKTRNDETKAKISASQMGHTYNLGKTHTDETKAKMSKAHKGKTYTLGKTLTDETKANMSKAQANQKHDPFYYNGEYFPNKTVCIKKYFPELSRCKFTTYMKKNPDLFS